MKEFQIRGVSFKGIVVDHKVSAQNEKEALSCIQHIYGRLKKPYDIFEKSFITDLTELPTGVSQRRIEPLLQDYEVIQITFKLRNKEDVGNEEYTRFRSYFRPLIRGAINRLWNDDHYITRDELEHEIYQFIIMEFMPKFAPERGRLRAFIKMNVESRIKSKRQTKSTYS